MATTGDFGSSTRISTPLGSAILNPALPPDVVASIPTLEEPFMRHSPDPDEPL